MILGMSIETFTQLHVILSLVGIVAGLVVLRGMLGANRLRSWTTLFLATTILTSVTGFMFPSKDIGPPHVIGAISLAVLAVALVAFYGRHLAGTWRWLYVSSAVLALYLNVLVGVVQAFQKLPILRTLAPTRSEPPFVVAQLLVLAIFLVAGFRAVARFHPPAVRSGRG
jgi:hypothetical protein